MVEPIKLKCARCKRILPECNFSRYSGNTRGRAYQCKDCRKKMRAKARNDNLKVHLQYLLGTSKHAAKRRGIPNYNIDVEYLESIYHKQRGLCAISGIELTMSVGGGCVATNISIDRVDNSMGYEKGNIQLVCRSVNAMKMNMTKEELERFMDSMSRNWLESRGIN